jgi:hypothetical protein
LHHEQTTTVETENILPSQSQSAPDPRGKQIEEKVNSQSFPSPESMDNRYMDPSDKSVQALGVGITAKDCFLSDYIGKYGSASITLKLTKKQISKIFLSKKASIAQLENLVKQMNR